MFMKRLRRIIRGNKAIIMGVLFGAQFLLMGKSITFQILHLLVAYYMVKIAFM